MNTTLFRVSGYAFVKEKKLDISIIVESSDEYGPHKLATSTEAGFNLHYKDFNPDAISEDIKINIKSIEELL